MPATVFPTPALARGPFEPLRRRCRGDERVALPGGRTGRVCVAHRHCETWEVYPCEANVPSGRFTGAGDPNFALPVFLAGARGDADEASLYPDCGERVVSSRILVSVQTIGAANRAGVGIPAGSVPPPFHFEVRGGPEAAVARLGRFVWTPTSWNDFGPLCVVAGAPVTQWEVWGWAEGTADGTIPLPYSLQFAFVIDRVSGSTLTANPVTENNVILDPT